VCWFVWYFCWWNKSTGGLPPSIPEGKPWLEVLQAGRPGARHSEDILRGTWCCRRCACLGKSMLSHLNMDNKTVLTHSFTVTFVRAVNKNMLFNKEKCQKLTIAVSACIQFNMQSTDSWKYSRVGLELETPWSHIQAWWWGWPYKYFHEWWKTVRASHVLQQQNGFSVIPKLVVFQRKVIVMLVYVTVMFKVERNCLVSSSIYIVIN